MLTTLLAAIEPMPGTLDVLEKVHGFYNDAWGQLMGVLALGFGLVAVLVPVLILIGQALLESSRKASFRLDKESMAREIASARADLAGDIAANKKDLAEVKQDLLRTVWRSLAMSGYGSARGAETAGMYTIALGHHAISIDCELQGYAAESEVRGSLLAMVRICGKEPWAQAARKDLHVLNLIRHVLDNVKKAGIAGESKEHIEFLEAFLVEAVSGEAAEDGDGEPPPAEPE